ncbi:uncharacterized protein LOC131245281 [Magnolia sinica]|uniref:uncharacterized protein LOC131245281 n=1 Tax=Magnolia sinica TaxID=86752 RepID=UPI0026595C13|nr:uncharacterized protein LOC131245281 [Magnolia sinica]
MIQSTVRPAQLYPQRPVQLHLRYELPGPPQAYPRPPQQSRQQVKPPQYQQLRPESQAPRPQAQRHVYALSSFTNDPTQLQEYEDPNRSYDDPTPPQDDAAQMYETTASAYEDPAQPADITPQHGAEATNDVVEGYEYFEDAGYYY